MNRKSKRYYVYIVVCADDTFYTGYTNDIESRVNKHNKGKGAKYTRGRVPVKLIYREEHNSKSSAMKREYQIKKLTHREKVFMIYEKTEK